MMTLAEVGEIFAYWQRHPPVHLLAGAFLGVTPAPTAAASAANPPPGFTAAPGGDLGMPEPELSVAAMQARNRARAAAIARRNAAHLKIGDA
jgi:hypothetical protein